ncbi:MAG: 30S ribosomal protein S12 methylthiotransferase RimO, partial [Acidiferrobacter sp.]
FPGETDAEFETLLAFVEEAGIDRLGAFAYSPVEGAAANALADPVPEAVKDERLERLMTLQARVSEERLRARIGRTYRVLIDEKTAAGAVGRTYAEAPDIDGLVHVSGGKTRPGDFVDCEIVSTDAHDLFGRISPALNGHPSTRA